MQNRVVPFAVFVALAALDCNAALWSHLGAHTVSAQTWPKLDAVTPVQLNEIFGKLPVRFEANEGQADAQVKFVARGPASTVFVTSKEAIVVLRAPRREEGLAGPSRNAIEPYALPIRGNANETVLRIRPVGARSSMQVVGRDELPGKSNYFIGVDPQKWRTGIRSYARVEYEDVFPGVNLVYYGSQRQLEYDFIVAPGADPAAIRLALEDRAGQALPLRIDTRGDLLVRVAGREISCRKPFVYQELNGSRRPVRAAFVLRDNSQVGFQVAAYDATKPLTIDPVLTYSTYLGGSGSENSFGDNIGGAIAVDDAGNVYVAGITGSANFPTANALQPTFSGSDDVFITKLDPTRSTLLYSTYLGGLGGDYGRSIAVDRFGNAYVAGYTFSNDFPTTAASFQSHSGGYFDAFVAKLNATGSALVYSTYLGGSDFDVGFSVAVDADGSAYLTGRSKSDNFPVEQPFQVSKLGASDAFIAKLNPAGSALVYSTYLGGTGDDWGFGIALGDLGTVSVAGRTESADFPTANPLQATLYGDADAYVAKLNRNGSALIYSTYLGGHSPDMALAIAVDAFANTYVTGFTASPDFPTAHPLQPALAGESDAFVTKLAPNGSALVYSTYLGGTKPENVLQGIAGIAVDKLGNTYVAGSTSSTDFPTESALQTANNGDYDTFVAKLNPEGSALVYSTYLGGSGFDTGNIAVDSVGTAYVTGYTSSNNFPTSGTALQTARNGTADAFIAILRSPCRGGCGDSGTVSISDVLTTLALALGHPPVPACTAADANIDGRVSVEDVLLAERSSLNGCQAQ